jgi:hypothetical protein
MSTIGAAVPEADVFNLAFIFKTIGCLHPRGIRAISPVNGR